MISTALFTVADIFRSHFQDFINTLGAIPKHFYAAAYAIMQCRTEALGGHIYRCNSCSHEVILYNSCRNRHCPQCQALARAKWVDSRSKELLPVPYFHCVFTIPHQLNALMLRNKRPSYHILFKAVSQTLLTVSKRLGGDIGFIAILHTWGQNLEFHPHIHCIVPAGAFNSKKNFWKNCKKTFFLPVSVMQKLFRGKCLYYLLKACEDKTIQLFSTTTDYDDFTSLIKKLYTIPWVVYVKKPLTSAQNLLKYLARYTNRVAIDNHRILEFNNGSVTFSYKDYRDNNKRKTMTVSAVEFIRRFMLHMLPDGFMRVRQYGFLSNKSKNNLLPQIRESVFASEGIKTKPVLQEKVSDGSHSFLCPICKKGTMHLYQEIVSIQRNFALAVND